MKFDNNFLQEQMQLIAKEDIKIISSVSLKLFASDVRDTFQKYLSEQVENTYKEIIDTIPETKQLDFIDLKTGYLISMNKWMNENPMRIPVIEIDEDGEASNGVPVQDLRKLVHRKETQIVGIGTAVSLCLLISGLKFVALLAESLAIALGIYEYKSQQEATIKANVAKEKEFQLRVNSFISAVENNAFEWLKMAERQSQLILSKFN